LLGYRQRKVIIDSLLDFASEIKQKEIDRVVFKTEQLHRFFPVSYTAEQMRREILEMLKLNMNKYWDE
jgi:ParB family transcriptional regulator, chromosome partitioning protein